MKGLKYVISVMLLVAAASLSTISCVKEERYLTDVSARLRFSCDTVKFDTVFVTIGSASHLVMVYNTYDQPILLSKVSLRGGTSSRFRINLDGDTSLVVRNLTIPAHDSLYLFVTANINPNASSTPFLVEDAVDFDFGDGCHQSLVLTAYGRNAVYHIPTSTIGGENPIHYSVIDCANWDHSLPHVILGYAVVDEGDVLNLTAGDELYFGNDACLWVFDGGSLRVSGSAEDPVIFSSVRHDGWYDSLPGQWGFIWLYPGCIDNRIDHAVIENGQIGLLADSNVNGNPTLRITNTIVRNQSLYGIYGAGSRIEGDNLLITACGQAPLALQQGGRYLFSNSTIANYWQFGSAGSGGNYIVSGGGAYSYALAVSNWYKASSGEIVVRDLAQCDFLNCIIVGQHGSSDFGEVMLADDASGLFNVRFDHCLVKSQAAMSYSEYSQLCEDADFVSTRSSDFHLNPSSPAVGFGSSAWVTIPYDLDGTPRSEPPSVGAYELIQ